MKSGNILTMMTIIMLLITPFTTILWGWVLSLLWLWFAVPFDLPPIKIIHACGLRALIAFATAKMPHLPPDDKDEKKRYHFACISYAHYLSFHDIGDWIYYSQIDVARKLSLSSPVDLLVF
jgi:hypothetical protein